MTRREAFLNPDLEEKEKIPRHVVGIGKQDIGGYGPYITIWLALMGLTGLTIAVAGINFGQLTVLLAMIIACVKAGLVLYIFMHLKYDGTLFRGILYVCLVVFIIFLILTFFDVSYRAVV